MPPQSVPSAMTMKRIHREMADLKKEDLGEMTLEPQEDNMYVWRGTIPGPQGSVYEGGIFDLDISLPSDYPFSAPKVIFKTRIYHMNISDSGSICIDMLKNNWSPALSLFKVMLSISSLLTDPNPKDPLVPSIATQYMRNRKLHDGTAKEWTTRYAKPKPVPVLAAKPVPQALASASTSTSTSSTPQPQDISVPVNGRGRVRRREPSVPVSLPVQNSTTGASGSATPVIVIEDDEPPTAGSSSGAAGSSRSTRSKRKVPSSTEVLDLVEDSQPAAVPAKRRRTTRSSNREEVIIIEDD